MTGAEGIDNSTTEPKSETENITDIILDLMETIDGPASEIEDDQMLQVAKATEDKYVIKLAEGALEKPEGSTERWEAFNDVRSLIVYSRLNDDAQERVSDELGKIKELGKMAPGQHRLQTVLTGYRHEKVFEALSAKHEGFHAELKDELGIVDRHAEL